MTGLWLLLGLPALLLLLLLVPCRIRAAYHEGELTADGRWLLWRFVLWPLPEKSPAAPPEKKPAGKPAAPKEKKDSRPFMDWLQLINDLLPALRTALRRIFGAVTLKQCRITMTVAAEEADQTALRYGRAHALLYTLYAFLSRHIHVREFAVSLSQDYLSGPEGEMADADLLLLISPLALLAAGFRLLWQGGRAYLRFAS